MKFTCPNANCKKNGKEIEILKYSSKNPPVCNECQTKLEFIKSHEGFCTNFGSFESMTPIQRQESLKKRSKEHFKKEIKERQFLINRGDIKV